MTPLVTVYMPNKAIPHIVTGKNSDIRKYFMHEMRDYVS